MIDDVGYGCHEQANSLEEAQAQVGARLTESGYTFSFIK